MLLPSFFPSVLLSVSGWDVAALCHSTDWCRAVCGGVCETHPRLPHAQPERPDCATQDGWGYLSLTRKGRKLESQSRMPWISYYCFCFLLFITQAPWRWFWSGWVGSSTQKTTPSSLMGNLLELNSSSLWVSIPLHIDPAWSTAADLKPFMRWEQYITVVVYQCSVVSSLAACGDLITAVFDFAHDMCALKLTEQQIALFSALVLINAGEINSSISHPCCILFFGFET